MKGKETNHLCLMQSWRDRSAAAVHCHTRSHFL